MFTAGFNTDCDSIGPLDMSEFFRHNWGNLASVAGLLVSGFGLIYAIKAEIAAIRAERTARSALQAVEATPAEARSRNIADELHDAHRRCQQIGSHLTQREWRIVQILAQELTASCSQILRRWDINALTGLSRTNLIGAQQQANSIVKASMLAAHAVPDQAAFSRMCRAQQRAFELLSDELAQIEGIIERAR